MHFEFIDEQEKFEKAAKRIAASRYLGIDTESDSLYSYYEKICLVQIACEHNIYLLDTLKVDISSLKEAFENPNIRKIFHSAESDIPLIKTKIDCAFSNIFDVMMAAKYLGIKKCGLNNLIEKFFSINLEKKYQKADWGERPIKTEMLNYAAMDVYYLKRLKDILIPELKKAKVFEEFMTHCEQFSKLPPKKIKPNTSGWLNLSGARNMTWPHSACLRELWLARENAAQKKDVPPFKILSNETILNMAREPERAIKNPLSFRGVSPYIISKHGDWIRKSIEKALNSVPEEKVIKSKSDRSHIDKIRKKFDILREWRKKMADERKLFPELILTNDILWKIASQENLSIQAISEIIGNEYKSALYASQLFTILSNADVME